MKWQICDGDSFDAKIQVICRIDHVDFRLRQTPWYMQRRNYNSPYIQQRQQRIAENVAPSVKEYIGNFLLFHWYDYSTILFMLAIQAHKTEPFWMEVQLDFANWAVTVLSND